MSDPDFMLGYIKSLGFEVRVTRDDELVAFAAHDPRTGETWVAEGSIDRQYLTAYELAEMVEIELEDG
jgi:inhibitor of KinA sporulation pathway (predicted exonuclease)